METVANSTERFKTLFLDNLNRYQEIKATADDRSAFEALYNCFENASRYSLGNEQANGYISKLKDLPEENLVRSSFMRLYSQTRHNTFLKKIKKLRSYQPIYNNETGRPSKMTKQLPFETFLDVLYTVRNNLRHGQKEYSEGSELIIRSSVDILDEFVDDLYKLIYADKIALNKRNVVQSEESLEKNITITFYLISLFLSFAIITHGQFYFDGWMLILVPLYALWLNVPIFSRHDVFYGSDNLTSAILGYVVWVVVQWAIYYYGLMPPESVPLF